jgi:phosphate transport system substrate-binding protein
MPMMVRRTLLLGCLAALFCGCGGDQAAGPAGPAGSSTSGAASSAGGDLKGTIQIDGSSTVYPITEAVAEDFRTSSPDVKITVGISGTGGGFKKFGRGETDISDASRPIKKSEAQTAAQSNIEYIELPIAYDALSVVVNPKNSWAQSITVAELKKMWEPGAQGKITKWSQVRAGWPDRPLKLYGAGSDSGTFDYFTDAINGKEGASRGDYTASEDDNVLVQGVSRDENALGYFGVAYYLENQAKLKAVPVDDEKADNGSGPQPPTVESVAAGTYQPLARPIFIYVSKKAAERPEVQTFVEYYLENAERLVKEVGYVPLQPAVYQLAEERFKNRTTGSMFGGGSQVGVKLTDLMKSGSAGSGNAGGEAGH